MYATAPLLAPQPQATTTPVHTVGEAQRNRRRRWLSNNKIQSIINDDEASTTNDSTMSTGVVHCTAAWQHELRQAHTEALKAHKVFQRSHTNVAVRQGIKHTMKVCVVAGAVIAAALIIVCGVVAVVASTAEVVERAGIRKKTRRRRRAAQDAKPAWQRMDIDGEQALQDVTRYAREVVQAALRRTQSI